MIRWSSCKSRPMDNGDITWYMVYCAALRLYCSVSVQYVGSWKSSVHLDPLRYLVDAELYIISLFWTSTSKLQGLIQAQTLRITSGCNSQTDKHKTGGRNRKCILSLPLPHKNSVCYFVPCIASAVHSSNATRKSEDNFKQGVTAILHIHECRYPHHLLAHRKQPYHLNLRNANDFPRWWSASISVFSWFSFSGTDGLSPIVLEILLVMSFASFHWISAPQVAYYSVMFSAAQIIPWIITRIVSASGWDSLFSSRVTSFLRFSVIQLLLHWRPAMAFPGRPQKHFISAVGNVTYWYAWISSNSEEMAHDTLKYFGSAYPVGAKCRALASNQRLTPAKQPVEAEE